MGGGCGCWVLVLDGGGGGGGDVAVVVLVGVGVLGRGCAVHHRNAPPKVGNWKEETGEVTVWL